MALNVSLCDSSGSCGETAALLVSLSIAVSAAGNAGNLQYQHNLFHASSSLCCRHIRIETAGQRLEDGVMAETQVALCLSQDSGDTENLLEATSHSTP